MSYKIIDVNNPVVLLKTHEVTDKNRRNKKEKSSLCDETLNLWMLHLYSIFKDVTNNLKFKDMETFVGNTKKSEIIHSTVGLFDICLPDMDINTIYGSVVDKEAYTILAFSSQANALKKIITKVKQIKNRASKINSIKEFLERKENEEPNSTENEDVYSSAEDKDDAFEIIFNEDDNNDDSVEDNKENDEDSSSDDDYSLGYNNYIKTVYKRKLNHLSVEPESISEVGFENQIIAAISFKLRHIDVRKIVHVTMLGVLKDYRSKGIGKHLINLVLDQKIVGKYDAVVVHADFSACDFFKKFGFSDDPILNIQWHTLEPEYTNCSLLTYLPAYSNQERENKVLAEEFSTAEMEVDIKLWQKKMIEVHCFQYQAFQKMKMEIQHLKETIKNQDKIMKTIMKELRESNKEKCRLERFLMNNCSSTNNISSVEPITSRTNSISKEENDPLDNVELKVKSHFLESAKMVGESDFIKFEEFIKSDPQSLLIAEFKAIKRSLNVLSPRLSSKILISSRILYYCESPLMKEDEKFKIITEGFAKRHRKTGSQGLGYYFASNPATAAIYARSNTVIVADVILGTIYRNIGEIQPLKESAPDGYDSILVASLYSQQSNNNAAMPDMHLSKDSSSFYSQEFVIFDAAQALPLGLISFSTTDSQ